MGDGGGGHADRGGGVCHSMGIFWGSEDADRAGGVAEGFLAFVAGLAVVESGGLL